MVIGRPEFSSSNNSDRIVIPVNHDHFYRMSFSICFCGCYCCCCCCYWCCCCCRSVGLEGGVTVWLSVPLSATSNSEHSLSNCCDNFITDSQSVETIQRDSNNNLFVQVQDNLPEAVKLYPTFEGAISCQNKIRKWPCWDTIQTVCYFMFENIIVTSFKGFWVHEKDF